jgi:hypothetical protein
VITKEKHCHWQHDADFPISAVFSGNESPFRQWLSQGAEAKIRADGQARILEEAERERRLRGLREYLDEYQAEHGACSDEEMARASRELGLPWPPAGDSA